VRQLDRITTNPAVVGGKATLRYAAWRAKEIELPLAAA
jgi:uncharacterized protein (DUF433 family)